MVSMRKKKNYPSVIIKYSLLSRAHVYSTLGQLPSNPNNMFLIQLAGYESQQKLKLRAS